MAKKYKFDKAQSSGGDLGLKRSMMSERSVHWKRLWQMQLYPVSENESQEMKTQL